MIHKSTKNFLFQIHAFSLETSLTLISVALFFFLNFNQSSLLLTCNISNFLISISENIIRTFRFFLRQVDVDIPFSILLRYILIIFLLPFLIRFFFFIFPFDTTHAKRLISRTSTLLPIFTRLSLYLIYIVFHHFVHL